MPARERRAERGDRGEGGIEVKQASLFLIPNNPNNPSLIALSTSFFRGGIFSTWGRSDVYINFESSQYCKSYYSVMSISSTLCNLIVFSSMLFLHFREFSSAVISFTALLEK
jgi:hypothetical protein